MKKRIIFILAFGMLLTGCGKEKTKETTTTTTEALTEALTEAPTESTTEAKAEKTANDVFREELEKADQKYKDAIKDYSIIYFNDEISATVNTTSGGMIAEAAEFTTNFFDSYEVKPSSYSIIVKYDDESGYMVSWDSHDNKTGFLMNTLTHYSENDVTVEGLYSWKEGK
jgi:hypothetical protein